MKTPIKTIERNNHLDHLTNVAPLIVASYLIQCWLMSHFFEGQKISHFAIPLAISLVIMMSGLAIYDTYHKVELFEDHLEISFSLFGTSTVINFSEIAAVEVLDETASFTNLIIKTTSNQHKVFYFVDDAKAIKEFIEKKDEHKGQNLDLVA